MSENPWLPNDDEPRGWVEPLLVIFITAFMTTLVVNTIMVL